MRALDALANRLRNAIARGVLKLVTDSAGLQIVQVALLEGELRGEIERVQNYGFTSHPTPGAEVIALFPAGSRSVGYVLAADHRGHRKKSLAEGEVAVYHRDGVTFVLLKTGEIQIKAATKVRVEAPTIEIIASTTATIEAPTINIAASTLLNIDAPTIDVDGSTLIDIDAPTLDLQNKGDYKNHVHHTVLSGGDLSGQVN